MYKFLIIVFIVNLSFSCNSQANIRDVDRLTQRTKAGKDSVREIHLFLGSASAERNNEGGYPVGERHAILVFSRQAIDTEPDWELATSHVEKSGWTQVDLQQASKVDPTAHDKNPDGKKAYDEAMSNGSAIIIYAEPLKDGE